MNKLTKHLAALGFLLAAAVPAFAQQVIKLSTTTMHRAFTLRLGRSADLFELRYRLRGVTDISFPVFGFYGNLVAALTVPFLELLDGSQKVGIDDARKYLENAAQTISATLGHHESLKKSRRKRG